MKIKLSFIILLILQTLVLTQALNATEIDTLWIKNLWHGYEEEIIKTMISPDDSLIFIGYHKPARIEVYNALNGDSIRSLTFPRSESVLDDYDISPNGKYIIACEDGDTINIIHIWDMKTGNHLRTILENDTNYIGFNSFSYIKFTPDSRYIFTSLGGKQFQDYKGNWHDSIPRFLVIDTLNWQVQREIGIARNYYQSPYDIFEISPDNKFYACPYYQLDEMPKIEFRDINNDTLISTLVDSANTFWGYDDLKFSPDSNYLMCNNGGYWYIWEIGQQNYFRKYDYDIIENINPLSFTKNTGIIAAKKFDTITNKFNIKFFNFITEIITKDFDIHGYEVLFFKTHNKFLIRGFYNLILIDSTWLTSVSNNGENPSDLVIIPNPATDYIEISVGAQGAVPNGVSIFDLLGVEQFTLTPTLSLKGEGVRLDISSLPPGVYFVRIGDVVRKFVKM